MSSSAVRLTGITKRFGATLANDDVALDVRRGTIHGILGENGAGKSTLMKILFGMIRPDAGRIEIDGVPVELRSSADALVNGLGMVQQHFSLVGPFTVVENLVLGRDNRAAWRRWIAPLPLTRGRERARAMSDRFGFGLDPDARCDDLSIGARQKVEIVKALWAGARTLVLDEPTAALSPPEAEELYALLERLRAEGTTVILISHKLPEILRLCDAVTVLRDGRVVGSRALDRTAPAPGTRAALEQDLVRLMIGREQQRVASRRPLGLPTALAVRGLTDGAGVGPIDLDVAGGEIVAVVGVEGNGQGALVDLLTGVSRCREGSIVLDGVELASRPARDRLSAGVAHIPEDRHARAVAEDMSLVDNVSIGFTDGAPFSRSPLWLSRARRRRLAETIIRDQRVRASGPDAPMRSLSGGNQQKVVVGRELARAPRLLIAAQPTRGLDIAATTAVHEALLRLRGEGAAILLVSLDLAEVFEISDRIVVLRRGRVVGETRTEHANPERLGAWMTGATIEGEAA